MIILDNFSKKFTCIVVNPQTLTYVVRPEEEVENIRHGEGGFSDENQLFALYTLADKIYFLCDNTVHEINPNDLTCKYTRLDKKSCEFLLKSQKEILCSVTYEPYINPQGWVFDEPLEEFDIILYLYHYLKNKKSLLKFIKGIENLNRYYQSQ